MEGVRLKYPKTAVKEALFAKALGLAKSGFALPTISVITGVSLRELEAWASTPQWKRFIEQEQKGEVIRRLERSLQQGIRETAILCQKIVSDFFLQMHKNLGPKTLDDFERVSRILKNISGILRNLNEIAGKPIQEKVKDAEFRIVNPDELEEMWEELVKENDAQDGKDKQKDN